jgi:uncharacterized protein (DUF2141 family)
MRRRAAALTGLCLLLAGNSAPEPAAVIDVHFAGLRSSKGMVRACLTRDPKHFPHCEKDPDSFKQSVVAGPDAHLRFTGVPAGDYAITVLHDENQNFKADMLLGIPREGFGFSENPVIRFGPPKFASARFRVEAGEITKKIVMKYLL